MAVRRSAVPEAPARVTLTWPDGAICNTWLRVTVKANLDTGLTRPDVFYYGNLVGETGDGQGMSVSAVDVVSTRSTRGGFTWQASRFDFNRDFRVNVLDVELARSNQRAGLGAIGAAPAGVTFAPVRETARRGAYAIEGAVGRSILVGAE